MNNNEKLDCDRIKQNNDLNAWAAINVMSSIQVNENLGITKNYNRSLYENQTEMKNYKRNFYGNKKTRLDPITGRVMHQNHNSTKNQYRSQYAKYASETDHKISLKEGHEIVKGNPILRSFTSDSDIKKILNNSKNFREIPRIINNTKRAENDIVYALGYRVKGKKQTVIKRIDNHLSPIQSVKFVSNHMSGALYVHSELATNALKNAGKEFAVGAVNSIQASAIPLMVKGVQNICQVASGQKTLEEASTDMEKMGGSILVSGGGLQLAAQLAKDSGSKLLTNAVKNHNELSQIVAVSVLVKDSFIRYINGKTSGREFFEEIGESGVGLIGNVIGDYAVGNLASVILPASVVTGPMGVIALASGVVGSIIISTVCTEIYRYSINLGKMCKAIDERHIQKVDCINRIANEAITEIANQKKVLKDMMSKHFKEWDEEFDCGFQQILTATLDNNFEEISSGLNTILAVFGESVMFKSIDEFDDFFFDDNAVLNL